MTALFSRFTARSFRPLLGVILGLWAASNAGAKAPRDLDFDLYDLDDKLFRLLKVRKAAKLVVVDFFSVSCAPCKRAIPAWKKIHRRWSSRGVKLVLVALPDRDDRRQALARIKVFFRNRPPFAVVWDKYTLVAKRFGVVKKGKLSLPQAFLLDRRGRILHRARSPQGIDAQIASRLKR